MPAVWLTGDMHVQSRTDLTCRPRRPRALPTRPMPCLCTYRWHRERAGDAGATTHAGVLRKKKEDHGRFEDPYKTVCLANLDDGVLSLRLTTMAR